MTDQDEVRQQEAYDNFKFRNPGAPPPGYAGSAEERFLAAWKEENGPVTLKDADWTDYEDLLSDVLCPPARLRAME